MFPLKNRKLIRGYQAHINAGLGGAADYRADHVPLYAPFEGFISTYYGQEGGNWSRLTRLNGDKLEFAHLSKYIAAGSVKEGQEIAITGNTGSITDYPHLHIQIIGKDGKRKDPETYQWESQPMITYPLKIKAKVVINGTAWQSLPAKLQEIRNWYLTHSGGKLDIEFTSSYSNFSNIPFRILPDGSAVIDEQWFDANVLDPQAHTTLLVVRDEDLPDGHPGGKLVARTLGYMGKTPTKIVVACGENDASEIYPSLNAFIDYAEHELMHTCYLFSGSSEPPPYGSGLDQTHKYFYDLKNREGSFSELNYLNINNLLKGTLMAKVKSHNNALYVEIGTPGKTVYIGINDAELNKAIRDSGEPLVSAAPQGKNLGTLEKGYIMDTD